jgi:hypothetical protein
LSHRALKPTCSHTHGAQHARLSGVRCSITKFAPRPQDPDSSRVRGRHTSPFPSSGPMPTSAAAGDGKSGNPLARSGSCACLSVRAGRLPLGVEDKLWTLHRRGSFPGVRLMAQRGFQDDRTPCFTTGNTVFAVRSNLCRVSRTTKKLSVVRQTKRTTKNLCRASYLLTHNKKSLLCLLISGAWQRFFSFFTFAIHSR